METKNVNGQHVKDTGLKVQLPLKNQAIYQIKRTSCSDINIFVFFMILSSSQFLGFICILVGFWKINEAKIKMVQALFHSQDDLPLSLCVG